jgi:hypothetical protein
MERKTFNIFHCIKIKKNKDKHSRENKNITSQVPARQREVQPES